MNMSEVDFNEYRPIPVFSPEPDTKLVAGRTGPSRNVALQPASSSVSGAASAPVGIPSSSVQPIPGPPGPPGPPGRTPTFDTVVITVCDGGSLVTYRIPVV